MGYTFLAAMRVFRRHHGPPSCSALFGKTRQGVVIGRGKTPGPPFGWAFLQTPPVGVFWGLRKSALQLPAHSPKTIYTPRTVTHVMARSVTYVLALCRTPVPLSAAALVFRVCLSFIDEFHWEASAAR